MARKFFLFILLVVVWAALYLLLSGGKSASFSNLFFGPVHPSDSDLPKPWGKQQIQVRLASQGDRATQQAALALASEQNANHLCPVAYHVQRGDTLGVIAQRCGVEIVDLMALNPQVTDANRIYPGQQLVIYELSLVESGHNESLLLHGARPGAALVVNVDGLPPLSDCQIGMGFSTAGFYVLASARTDQQGAVKTVVTVPASAAAGDQAFILVTVRTPPAVQVVSDTFEIVP